MKFFSWVASFDCLTCLHDMKPIRRAVIDVGTNSVKLLVADVTEHQVQPLHEAGVQTRLGRGFYKTHVLQPKAIEQTARAVADFAVKAREWKAVSIRIFATSAARDAVNPNDLTSAIKHAAGLEMEIISGEQEADWVFKGVTTNAELAQQPLLILDVGGGSTEFILGQGEQKHFRRSFSLGTVRLLEKLPHGDPPAANELAECRQWLKSFLDQEVRSDLERALKRETKLASEPYTARLVGTGGTAVILARIEAQLNNYDRERIEAVRLSRAQVNGQLERLWSLPLAERKHIVGLPPERADVILTGVAIYDAVMDQFGFAELRVSTRGLRFAAVLDET
jgi:exopolyphosphatase/guanosine-5'-triphosphate,3'-diphosphate pyrophosphatase